MYSFEKNKSSEYADGWTMSLIESRQKKQSKPVDIAIESTPAYLSCVGPSVNRSFMVPEIRWLWKPIAVLYAYKPNRSTSNEAMPPMPPAH